MWQCWLRGKKFYRGLVILRCVTLVNMALLTCTNCFTRSHFFFAFILHSTLFDLRLFLSFTSCELEDRFISVPKSFTYQFSSYFAKGRANNILENKLTKSMTSTNCSLKAQMYKKLFLCQHDDGISISKWYASELRSHKITRRKNSKATKKIFISWLTIPRHTSTYDFPWTKHDFRYHFRFFWWCYSLQSRFRSRMERSTNICVF